MAKYRRNDLEEDNGLTYAEEMQKQQSVAETGPEPVDAEDAAFKKRYGDLRRHSHQLMQQKDQQLAQMKTQLETAARGQIKFPKTDEEIDNWSKRYPDVAKIVDSIAQKRANEALEQGVKRMDGLRKFETKLVVKEAEQVLMQAHPDFAQIRQDPAFHDWVAMQPQNIIDSLYKNNTDALAASRAIDLYKADTGSRKTSNSAARAVGKSVNISPSSGKAQWSESQIDKMSNAEFNKHEEDIIKAMQTGNFVYDMSGGARQVLLLIPTYGIVILSYEVI